MTNMHQIELFILVLEIIFKTISLIWQPNVEIIWLFEIQLSRRPFPGASQPSDCSAYT